MKIKSVNLKDFKRFADLVIKDIPESARLVILVGPNGSGKSSVFEAFNVYLTRTKGSLSFDRDYHVKVSSIVIPASNDTWYLFQNNKVSVTFHDHLDINWNQPQEVDKNAFYIRSSYRYEADFSVNSLQRQGSMLEDTKRPMYMLSTDSRVSDNYQRMVASALAEIYDKNLDDNSTRKEIRDRLLSEVRDSLLRVLPSLELTGPGDPMEDGTFLFTKGQSVDWKYKNLSSGEKAAFDLLLDFVIKIEKFNNTVFCIDEPEVHMHTEVQGPLLKEMLHKLPPTCQLWIATHSIGMMRAAKELSESNSGSVVFLDFGGHNFDERVELTPAVTTREFWKRNFAVAIGDLADLVAPSRVVFCEGSRDSQRNSSFDAKCFQTIFAAEFPDVAFVSLGSSNEVEKNSLLISSVVKELLSGIEVSSVRDRDDRNDVEVEEGRNNGINTLSLRNLECYLLDDEIIEKFCLQTNNDDKTEEVKRAKQDALHASISRGQPSDDLKSMSGEFYNKLRRILELRGYGNTVDVFCRDTLATLVTSDTAIYQLLKQDVFGLTK